MKKEWVLSTIGMLTLALQTFAAGGAPTKSFTVSKGGTLEVSVSQGDIRILPWDRNEVLVKVPGSDEEDMEDFRIVQDGNNVVVRGDSNVVRLEVNVPSQFNLDLHTSGGEIEIRGPMTGELKGSTSGGDINLSDAGPVVDFRTSGGNVVASKILGDASLQTSGGDLEVQNVSGNLDAVTQGGNVTIGNVDKTLKVRSGGGNIEIGNVGGPASISTGGGELIVGKVSGNVDLSTGGGSIQLNGGTGTITARTGGGDITLKAISGAVQAKTGGGDVVADLIPKGASRLISAGGDIELSIPDNSKITIDAVIRIRGRWSDAIEESDIVSDFKAANYTKDSNAKEIRGQYVLNGGGENIYLETVNGSIEIRKRQ